MLHIDAEMLGQPSVGYYIFFEGSQPFVLKKVIK